MLCAIETKYLGPTNHMGSRVKAIAKRRTADGMPELSLTDNWDHGSNAEENHARVAKLLAHKLNWSGLFVGGSIEGAGFVFVNAGRVDPLLIDPMTRRGKEDRDWFTVKEEQRA